MSIFRALLALLAFAAPACAGALPVPSQVIYPGDKISAAMLNEVEGDAAPGEGIALSRADIVGKVARRTLLPGQTIPMAAVEEPRAVQMGALVKLIYLNDGLSIVTTAQALQNGFIGQVVQVRNLESGNIVMGTIQNDGAVLVNGG